MGTIRTLPDALAALGVNRPLVVSDHGLGATGVLDQLTAMLPAGVLRFVDVPANPTEAAVLGGLAAYRQCGCDDIVAIGGGSPIDLAKGVSLLRSINNRCHNTPRSSAGPRASARRWRQPSPSRPPPAPRPGLKWGPPPC